MLLTREDEAYNIAKAMWQSVCEINKGEHALRDKKTQKQDTAQKVKELTDAQCEVYDHIYGFQEHGADHKGEGPLYERAKQLVYESQQRAAAIAQARDSRFGESLSDVFTRAERTHLKNGH